MSGSSRSNSRPVNRVHDGRLEDAVARLITGQQEYSGAEVARLVIEALGT
jgi:hypothetical protein